MERNNKTDFLIIGAGRSIVDNHAKILKFRDNRNLITIGINNMSSVIVPDYHLWTNKKRFIEFHTSIKSSSKLLLGCGIPAKVIRQYHKGDYQIIKYKDADRFPLKITPNMITGRFRTAGTLAIAIAHSWNPLAKIFIAGMDGYTLYSQKKLQSKKEHHHCYGEGFTDDANWEKCLRKDKTVHEALTKLKNHGIDFSIITPTVFKNFYKEMF